MDETKNGRKLEILVADDDYMSYMPRFKKAFNGKVNFSAVDNAAIALRLVQERNYDAVVLNPGILPNPYQLAFKMKSSKENVRIIGFSSAPDPDMAAELGFYAYAANEEHVAQAIARLSGMDKQTYEREVRPHFNHAGGRNETRTKD